MSKEFLRGRRLETAADVEGWWRSGDGGWDRVVKRYAIDDFNAANYQKWLERVVPSDDPTTEIWPVEWWSGFWDIGQWWTDLRPGL